MQGKKREGIEALAQERGSDDASSLYPGRYTDYRLLRIFGRGIAMKDYSLFGRRAKLFAHGYASAYQNEIAVLDSDECYEYYGMTKADLEGYVASMA